MPLQFFETALIADIESKQYLGLQAGSVQEMWAYVTEGYDHWAWWDLQPEPPLAATSHSTTRYQGKEANPRLVNEL